MCLNWLHFPVALPMLAVRFRERECGMKTVIASIVVSLAAPALAQTTIYKHVDESGRVTYTNKPMKGAASGQLCGRRVGHAPGCRTPEAVERDTARRRARSSRG